MEFLHFTVKIFTVLILLITQKCEIINLYSQRVLFTSLKLASDERVAPLLYGQMRMSWIAFSAEYLTRLYFRKIQRITFAVTILYEVYHNVLLRN